MPEKPPVSSTIATLFTWSTRRNSQTIAKNKGVILGLAKTSILDHLFQPLVDNAGPSHISKPSSSSVAVTPLCLSSDGKERFENKLCFIARCCKTVDKFPKCSNCPKSSGWGQGATSQPFQGLNMCRVHTVHCRLLKTEYLGNPNPPRLDPSKTSFEPDTSTLLHWIYLALTLGLPSMDCCLERCIRCVWGRWCITEVHTLHPERKLCVRGFVWNTLYALRLVLVISQTAPARALPTSFIHSEVYSSYMANTGSLVLVWETNAVKPSVCLPI